MKVEAGWSFGGGLTLRPEPASPWSLRADLSFSRFSATNNLIRVVDESGDDYLYPEGRFIEAELPQAARRAVLQAA